MPAKVDHAHMLTKDEQAIIMRALRASQQKALRLALAGIGGQQELADQFGSTLALLKHYRIILVPVAPEAGGPEGGGGQC